MGIAVGIDLGTTYSAVARINPQTGRAEVIPNAEGDAVTPSVVGIASDGRILFGTEAKEQQELGDTNTAAFFKRYMGQSDYTIRMAGRDYTPIDLSGMLLQGLVRQAEQVSGEKIDGAYITVPAYFRNSEREATIEAGRRAGINVLGILNEPTAAAFAYGLNGKNTHQKVLIYDLGGGTFDVTLAEVDGDSIRVLGSDGSHILGGKDWDDAVARWIIEQFSDEFDIDLTDNDEELARLTVMAESAKKRLTKAPSATITVNFEGHRGQYVLDRETFDDVTSFMLQETSDIVDRLFASVRPRVTWADVDGAILVGGSTRMLQVRDYITRMSGKPPLGGVNVDEAVALGAAIRANQDAAGHVSPMLTIGGGRRATIGGGTAAAPRMLIGGKRISDATSHALGMILESTDRSRYVNGVLIPKNSPIPAENMRSAELRVPRSGGELEVYLLQGAETRPLDNEVAGKYVFSDIPYVQGGRTIINVSYRYDENGVIQVSAVQQETGRQLVMHREPIPEDMSWTDGSPADNQPESVAEPGTVYLLIDLSGSMSGRPLQEAIKAANDFVSQLDLSTFAIGVGGFGSKFVNFCSPTHDERALRDCIDSLGVGRKTGYGTESPLGHMPPLLSEFGGTKLIIILTDGSWFNAGAAVSEAQRCNDMGIDTIGIGIGEADEKFLKRISSIQDLSGLTDLSHLSESFSKIARAIS